MMLCKAFALCDEAEIAFLLFFPMLLFLLMPLDCFAFWQVWSLYQQCCLFSAKVTRCVLQLALI